MDYHFDKIIIGAGIYGLYAALVSCKKGQKVLVLDKGSESFERGSLINQARLHNGYHYPRSYSTAVKSSFYYQRFRNDFTHAINDKFTQIYGIAKNYSWANGVQFKNFCNNLKILCEDSKIESFFNPIEVESAFVTDEVSFDAIQIKNILVKSLQQYNCTFIYNSTITKVNKAELNFSLELKDGSSYSSNFVLNATYASTNEIHSLFDFEALNVKYELCEVILCKVSDNFKNLGITLMDGPFFSIMPFGNSGFHSITSVSHTPHLTSYSKLPTFPCQLSSTKCKPNLLDNCNLCSLKPKSAYSNMFQIAKKYLNSNFHLTYERSLFTIKPILINSEIDDSRPTIIKKLSSNPDFYTVFSGKINTIYDLDSIL
jgi:hypothetical protein